MNIVVVEDEFKAREGLVKLITKLDPSYKVIGQAENGLEGMSLIEALLPDLIITDIKMPRVSGIEMIKHLRCKNIFKEYIILTSYAEFEFARECIKLGINEYLLKPILLDELKEILEQISRKIEKGKVNKDRPEESQNINSHSYSFFICKILNVIERDFSKKLLLEDVAENLGVTPEYLSSLFKKETGKCFSDYLKEYRIKKSKRMIECTNDKIYEIALKVGYNDPKYFCRVFKEIIGISASEYKKSLIK